MPYQVSTQASLRCIHHMQALAEGQRVVIDLDFEGLMSESDARHLVQQLSFAYAANKAVSNPLHLQLTSLHGPMKERATKQIAGEMYRAIGSMQLCQPHVFQGHYHQCWQNVCLSHGFSHACMTHTGTYSTGDAHLRSQTLYPKHMHYATARQRILFKLSGHSLKRLCPA